MNLSKAFASLAPQNGLGSGIFNFLIGIASLVGVSSWVAIARNREIHPHVHVCNFVSNDIKGNSKIL